MALEITTRHRALNVSVRLTGGDIDVVCEFVAADSLVRVEVEIGEVEENASNFGDAIQHLLSHLVHGVLYGGAVHTTLGGSVEGLH